MTKYRTVAADIEKQKQEQLVSRRKKRLAENYEQRVQDMNQFMNSPAGNIY